MTIAFAATPSKNRPGTVNVFVPGKGWLSVDEAGNLIYGSTNVDLNYQQFKRTGFSVEITPGDDNPVKVAAGLPTFVLIPE